VCREYIRDPGRRLIPVQFLALITAWSLAHWLLTITPRGIDDDTHLSDDFEHLDLPTRKLGECDERQSGTTAN
jgi:hypothetical protein